MATTQENIDSLITHIESAEKPNSVTNVEVARVLDYLNGVMRHLQNDLIPELERLAKASGTAAGSASESATNAQKIVDAFTKTKGMPNGIAPLDGEGQVPANCINSRYDDVLYFDRVIDFTPTTEMTGATAQGKVVYCKPLNQFLYEVAGDKLSYYTTWNEDGVTADSAFGPRHAPEKGKLYVCTSLKRAYFWDGSALVGEGLIIGEKEGEAYSGAEGKQLAENSKKAKISIELLKRWTALLSDDVGDWNGKTLATAVKDCEEWVKALEEYTGIPSTDMGDWDGKNIPKMLEEKVPLDEKLAIADPKYIPNFILPFEAIYDGDIAELQERTETSIDGVVVYWAKKKKFVFRVEAEEGDIYYADWLGAVLYGTAVKGQGVTPYYNSRLYYCLPEKRFYYFDVNGLTDIAHLKADKDEVYTTFNKEWDIAVKWEGGYKPDEAPDKSKPYLLYGVWWSYEDAVKIMDAGHISQHANESSMRAFSAKANLPFGYASATNYARTFYNNRTIEVAFVSCAMLTGDVFSGCTNLRQVCTGEQSSYIYKLAGANNVKNFVGCTNLEMVYGQIRDNYPIDVQDCLKLTLANFQYWVNHAYNTGTVTITVHQDIYDALTGKASAYPFNGGTQEEWEQLLTEAVAKNISFATA